MTPFLDSLVIMMSLICLVLVVMIIPVIQNPKQFNVLSFEKLIRTKRNPLRELQPTYIDCRPDRAVIIPGDEEVTIEDLVQSGNAIDRLFARVQAHSDTQYIILLARPGSLPVYRHLRKELLRRGIAAGADVLDMNAVLDWRKEMRELNITLPET